MPSKIHLRPQVRLDVAEIAEYLSQDKASVAERFLKAVEKTFEQLALSPELGIAGEFDSKYLRGILRWRIKGFESYLVFYRPTVDKIEIVRVLHGARDIDQLFDANL